MSEPISDTRLEYLRRENEPIGDHTSSLTADEVNELLAEVDRLRAHNAMHGYAAPITFVDGEDGQPQWPARQP